MSGGTLSDMIFVLRKECSDADVQEVVARLTHLGLRERIFHGADRTMVATAGDCDDIDVSAFESLPAVELIVPTVSDEAPSPPPPPEGRREVCLGPAGAVVGGQKIAIIAGPCSVEDRTMLLETAHAVREAGAVGLRGGAFKPRTNPYSFQGLNRPLKLTLSKDGVEARAIFRTVDKKRSSARVGRLLIRDYHDSYIYECAAYKLSRLLDIDNVPPCVLRTIDGQKGSLQLWIEQATTEFQNRYDVDGPRASERWPSVFDTMHVFDALIDNFDRHPGNVLVDSRDRVWFIDHTRSFRLYTAAPKLELAAGRNPDHLNHLNLIRALHSLDKKDLEVLKPFVSFRHIDALMRRRDQILEQLTGGTESPAH